MATEIKDKITLELIINKINNNEVISEKKYTYITPGKKGYINIFQIFKNEEEKIIYRKFDIYGNKRSDNYIDISDIENIINLKTEKNWFYHKKRISKKTKNPKIIDENSAKKKVYEWLIKKYKKDIIIPEISLNNRRADYIVFGDNIITIEIKSEIDTLERLESQLKEYSKFSNYIYIALHTNKIQKIEKLDIKENIGIIDITDKKIKILKQPKKIKNTYIAFEGFISYKEFLNMKRGFKGHSKVSKEDFELFFQEALTKKDKELIIKEIMKKRYILEDKKRKELFFNKEYDKAVSSSKNIGINRMTTEAEVYVKILLNKQENYLNEYINKKEEEILKLLPKELKKEYKELLIKDSMFFLMIFRKLEIPYQNQYSILFRMKNIKDNIKIIKDKISEMLEIIDNEFEKIKKELINKENKILIEVNTKGTMLKIKELCKENEIKYKIIKKSEISKINNIFETERTVLIENSSFQFYRLHEDIKKIRLYID